MSDQSQNPDETWPSGPRPTDAEVAYWQIKMPAEQPAQLENLRCQAYFAQQAKLDNYLTELPRMQTVVRVTRLRDKQ